MLFGEVAEEAVQQFTLFIGQISQVVQFMNVAQIGKDTVGICHILVNVVEVADKQLSPAEELVECLVGTRLSAERLMEVAYQFQGVGNTELRLLSE